jgi:hypothetical protein
VQVPPSPAQEHKDVEVLTVNLEKENEIAELKNKMAENLENF